MPVESNRRVLSWILPWPTSESCLEIASYDDLIAIQSACGLMWLCIAGASFYSVCTQVPLKNKLKNVWISAQLSSV